MNRGGLAGDERVMSYLTLRKATGWIGISLPFVLAVVNMLLVGTVILQGSVSGYYYTGVRDVLVGGLCAIGIFLFTYRGYNGWDKWLTNLAGIFAVGVAFFPTAPPNPSTSDKIVGYVHLTCAASLFVTLAVIALWLFRKAEPDAGRRLPKRRRDRVYLVCGIVIALCVAGVPVESLLIGAPIARFEPLFWLEATAVFAFGVAWLVKGQAILADRDEPPPPVPPAPARELAKRS